MLTDSSKPLLQRCLCNLTWYITIKWKNSSTTCMFTQCTTCQFQTKWHGQGSDNETHNCQIHPSSQTTGLFCVRHSTEDMQQTTVIVFWSTHSITSNTGNAYTQYFLHWQVLLPWLCLCKLGYQVLKTTPSAALTQQASKRVPAALSYSWTFLVNILFVWFEIDLSPSHFDKGKQTSNWSASIIWFWISFHFVVPFWKRLRVPAAPLLPHAHPNHTDTNEESYGGHVGWTDTDPYSKMLCKMKELEKWQHHSRIVLLFIWFCLSAGC